MVSMVHIVNAAKVKIILDFTKYEIIGKFAG